MEFVQLFRTSRCHPFRALAASCVIASLVSLSPSAVARLKPQQVLLVYDARDPDQITIAEHYAGSAEVPGGVGNLPGTRPGVRVFDLSSAGRPQLTTSDILPSQFINDLRDPIRDHLLATNLDGVIRSIVLVRGTPHRLLDFDDPPAAVNPNAVLPRGDIPNDLASDRANGDASNASVDAELALLWQDLQDDEAGARLDSRADGPIRNPYYGSLEPITRYSNAHRFVQKPLNEADGISTRVRRFSTGSQALTPGDLILVTRLDGTSLGATLDLIQRSKGVLFFDPGSSALIFDESDADGIISPPNNGEFDNSGGALNAGDDYELARDLAQIDGRWNQSLVYYNGLGGQNQFFVGPNGPATLGIVIEEPIALLASYGRNHGGGDGSSRAPGGSAFVTRYNYAPVSIFNTLESYNGRPLNGLGKRFDQASCIEFTGAGGTFAIGNVYEPLADTISDNTLLIRNFLLGDLTWAEAAYSSLPALSWMQIVIGDPLASVTRATEDINGDGRVDLEDLYTWPANPTDINNDGVADGSDRMIIYKSIRARDNRESDTRRTGLEFVPPASGVAPN